MVHAFIISRIDYCNSILYDVGAVYLRPRKSFDILALYKSDYYYYYYCKVY